MEITGKIENLEPNPLGMRIAEALRKLQSGVNRAADRPFALPSLNPSKVNVAQGGKLGDALFEDAQKEAENLAYGDLPMRMPEMSKIPVMKTGRKKGVADLMLLGADVAPVANIAHKAAGRAVSKGLEQVAAKVPQGVKQGAREIQQAVVGSGPTANIIKGKGGNWAPGHIEFITDYLRTKRPKLDDPTQDAALDNWITGTMGKYLKNDWGTMDDPVKQASRGRPDVPYNPNRGHMQYDEFDKYTQGGGWGGADANDATYAVARQARENRSQADDIASLDDAQKKGLGILENTFDNPERIGRTNRGWQDNDTLTGGILFEDITDAMVRPESAKNYVGASKHAGLEVPEWLEKLPSERAVHTLPVDGDPGMRQEFKDKIDDLGFPRMVELIAEELRAGKIPVNAQGRIQLGVRDAAQRLVKSAIDEPKNISTKSTKDLPAFKGLEYEDGSKWVEIPPNRNQLRAEGDLMGHCVGSYCTMLERGEKRIISLRDAQGMPNVTIDAEGNLYRHREHQKADSEGLGNISQAMGKGNSFPDKYLPKVQDFLRKTNPDSINLIEPVGRPEPNPTDRFAEMAQNDPTAYAFGLRSKSKAADALDPLRIGLPDDVSQELKDLKTVDKNGQWVTDEDLNRLADKVPKQEFKFDIEEVMDVAPDLRYMENLTREDRILVRELGRVDILRAFHNQGDNWRQMTLDIREANRGDRAAAERVMRTLRGERNVYDELARAEAVPAGPQDVARNEKITERMREFEEFMGYRLADNVFTDDALFADADRLITMLDIQLANDNQQLADRIINAMRLRGLLEERGYNVFPPDDLVDDVPPDGDLLL
jgi:hypothetical protein